MLPNENLKNLSPKYGQKKNRNYANVSSIFLVGQIAGRLLSPVHDRPQARFSFPGQLLDPSRSRSLDVFQGLMFVIDHHVEAPALELSDNLFCAGFVQSCRTIPLHLEPAEGQHLEFQGSALHFLQNDPDWNRTAR